MVTICWFHLLVSFAGSHLLVPIYWFQLEPPTPPPNRDEAERSEAMERFPPLPQIVMKRNGVKQGSDSPTPTPNRDEAERSEARERTPSLPQIAMKRNEVKQWSDSPPHPQIAMKRNEVKQGSESLPSPKSR